MRRISTFTVVVFLVAGVAVAGAAGAVGAAGDEPGDPAAYYGDAMLDDGSPLEDGTVVAAVVDGEVRDTIEVADGEYGGDAPLDAKLRVDTGAGDEVSFTVDGADGPVAETIDLEAGTQEVDLEFDAGEVPTALTLVLDGETDTLELEPGAEADVAVTVTYADGSEETVTDSATLSSDDESVVSVDDATAVAGSEGRATVTAAHDDTTDSVDVVVDDGADADDGGDDGSSAGGDDGGDGDDAEGDAASDDGGDTDAGGDDGDDTDEAGSGGGAGGGAGGAGGGGGPPEGADDDSPATDDSGTDDSTAEDDRSTTHDDQPVELPEPVISETRPIEDDEPDGPGPSVSFESTTIAEIVIHDGAPSGEVTVEESDAAAEGVPALPGEYRVVTTSVITVPDEARDSHATIRATVTRDQLDERGLSSDHLTVFRLASDGDGWEELDADVSETGGDYLVEAGTQGFSPFVVASRAAPPETPTGSSPDDGDDHDGPVGPVFAGVGVLVLGASFAAAGYWYYRQPQRKGRTLG